MSNKHTPGPWIIGESYTNEPAIRNTDGDCVAVACELLEGEAEANARLIAASPELLAALEECITHDGALAWRSAVMAGKRLEAISNIARKAIQKATKP